MKQHCYTSRQLETATAITSNLDCNTVALPYSGLRGAIAVLHSDYSRHLFAVLERDTVSGHDNRRLRLAKLSYSPTP